MVAFLGVLVMLVAGLLRSGQRYVYCVGMQAILTHACCSGHDDADGADRTSSMTPLAAMDETPDPCCEVHRLRDLPAGTSGAGAWKSSAVAADDGPPGKVMAVGPMLPTLDGGYARCGSLTGAMRGPPNAERIAERASLRRWNERVVYRL